MTGQHPQPVCPAKRPATNAVTFPRPPRPFCFSSCPRRLDNTCHLCYAAAVAVVGGGGVSSNLLCVPRVRWRTRARLSLSLPPSLPPSLSPPLPPSLSLCLPPSLSLPLSLSLSAHSKGLPVQWHALVHEHKHIHRRTYMHACILACRSQYIRTCSVPAAFAFRCMHTRARTHTYNTPIHTHTHTHTHTCIQRTRKHLPQSFLHLLKRHNDIVRRYLDAGGWRHSARMRAPVGCVRARAHMRTGLPLRDTRHDCSGNVLVGRRTRATAAHRRHPSEARRQADSGGRPACAGGAGGRGGCARRVLEGEPRKVLAKLDLRRRAIDQNRGPLRILSAAPGEPPAAHRPPRTARRTPRPHEQEARGGGQARTLPAVS